jgi:hypothetical protein
MDYQRLQQKVNELEQKVKSLEASTTISFDVEQAFRTRFNLQNLESIPVITSSAKVATTENQVVDEAGSASYSVLKPPDAFLEVSISGATKYIPIYT